ncbi:putative CBL-interacting protein kinase 23 [Blattamonas nauphoetae]|uniref:non-specific serine/threonine protein kinase n=1 Tax=Blattamonas nauphoetae TaxID=2049346 RepID=A0ABQ9Y718_9EUKA|nr:putative CBL-interacting protein kinase 23 [Blattamonas nauphoetae]
MNTPHQQSHPQQFVKVNKYILGPTLGEGTFGKVKQCKNSMTGETLAIKIIDKSKVLKHHMTDQLKREISLMKKLSHENIIGMHEVLASKTKVFIVLELARGGELFQKIADSGRFDEDTARKYFQQLVRGVDFCHQNGICHRDLKPENLLLDESGVLKITDFGLCALSDAENVLLKTQCGTPNYTAPEILDGGEYEGKPTDVWSCGVILFVMLAGYLPFEEDTNIELFRKIKKAEFSYPSFFPQAPKSLINKILNPSPSARATIEDIKSDPWFTRNLHPHFFNPAFSVVQNTIPRPRGRAVSLDASFSQELSYPTALTRDREWAGLGHPGMTRPPRHSQKFNLPILNQPLNWQKVETEDTTKQADKDQNKKNYLALADGLPRLGVKVTMEDINKAIRPVDEDEQSTPILDKKRKAKAKESPTPAPILDASPPLNTIFDPSNILNSSFPLSSTLPVHGRRVSIDGDDTIARSPLALPQLAAAPPPTIHVRSDTKFLSLHPLSTLLARVKEEVIKEKGIITSVTPPEPAPPKVVERDVEVAVTFNRKVGTLTMTVCIQRGRGSFPNIVLFRRGKGSVISFMKLYKQIHTSMSDLCVEAPVTSPQQAYRQANIPSRSPLPIFPRAGRQREQIQPSKISETNSPTNSPASRGISPMGATNKDFDPFAFDEEEEEKEPTKQPPSHNRRVSLQNSPNPRSPLHSPLPPRARLRASSLQTDQRPARYLSIILGGDEDLDQPLPKQKEQFRARTPLTPNMIDFRQKEKA